MNTKSMMLKILKKQSLTILLVLFILTIVGCEKDKLIVDQKMEYAEVRTQTSANPYDGGWHLILNPDGSADILPGGDIRYAGTYKINGSIIKVKTEQNSGSYDFEIISETEIKDKQYGVVLKLKQ